MTIRQPPPPRCALDREVKATGRWFHSATVRENHISPCWMSLAGTLGRSMDVQGNFHLDFICRWLYVFTRSETAGTKILFNCFMSTTNATDLAKNMLRGRHFMGLNSLNFILCSWCHLVQPMRRPSPVCAHTHTSCWPTRDFPAFQRSPRFDFS